MPRSIKECFDVLKPGGMVLFRDYGNKQTNQLILPSFWEDKSIAMWYFSKSFLAYTSFEPCMLPMTDTFEIRPL